MWQDAQGLLEESRSLEKKVHLASEAQKAAKDVEQDYAEVTESRGVIWFFLGGFISHRDTAAGAGQEMLWVLRKRFGCVMKKTFFAFQVIKLLEKELDSYKAKEAEPTPDVVS